MSREDLEPRARREVVTGTAAASVKIRSTARRSPPPPRRRLQHFFGVCTRYHRGGDDVLQHQGAEALQQRREPIQQARPHDVADNIDALRLSAASSARSTARDKLASRNLGLFVRRQTGRPAGRPLRLVRTQQMTFHVNTVRQDSVKRAVAVQNWSALHRPHAAAGSRPPDSLRPR